MNTNSIFKKGVNLLTLASFLLWNVAAAAPEGGSVAQGSAVITQSGSQTNITQTSQNAVINWNGFDTAQHEAVKFNQPNSSSIVLNRINSGQPTNFQGSLSANGQVWILNPSGVLFGANSKVDVAGLVVTTHNITDSNFMSGHYQFNPVVGFEHSKIINNGLISAKDSGIVALVAPGVENNGTIIANLGKVHLASGSSFVLDMYGDSLINFGSNPGIQNGYVSNSGLIQADGGKVHMTANAAAGVLNGIISMSGTIQAKSVGVNKNGEIILCASDGASKNLSGTTRVSGKLKASFVETSGHVLVIEPTTVIEADNWLIDPADITITNVNANVTGSSPFQPTATGSTLDIGTLTAALSLGNVTVQTNNDGFAGNGDITVATPITWTSTSTLTLNAFRNIYLNSDITALNGGLTLIAAYTGAALTVPSAANVSITSGSSGSPSATGVTANINVKDFHLQSGVWFQVNPALPQFNISNSFKLSNDNSISAGISHSFMRALGGTGAPGTPYQLTDIYGVQGINASDGSTLLTKSYILANNIDAMGTRTWNNGLGFHPIGFWNTFYTGFVFQGNFNGNGNVINGLYVNRAQTETAIQGEMGSALFAVTGAGAVIQNIGLTNVDITSLNDRAGGLVAFGTYQSTTTISNSYVTGKVTGNGGCCVGGVVGYMGSGFISTVYNNATVTSNGGSDVGGVVGYLLGASLTNSYNVGKIFAVGSVSNVGGLVGTSTGSPVITNSYNSGPVNNAFGTAGGLVGFYNTGTIINSYYDTQTSLTASAFGSGSTSGVTGLTTAQMMQPANFVGWTIADGSGAPAGNVFSGATSPSSASFPWVILTGNTRPILTMEWSPSIKTPHQVQLMAVAKAANYSLAYNIDMYDALTSASDVWGTNFNFPSGAGFVPIGAGSAATAFTGTFNGNNLIINNLYINRPTTNFVGLFGTNIGVGTTISNVGLTNVNITGRANVGGLIGQNGNGGDAGFTGGTGVNLPGNTASNVSNVYVTGSVNSIQTTNTFSIVGGLIGYHTSGLVSDAYSTANVTASSAAVGLPTFVGGFIGDSNADITRSFSTGNVTVTSTGSIGVGGFVGQQAYGTISQSYSSGNVTVANGALAVGGFVGLFSGNPGANLIINSYSVSSLFISNSTAVGGFAGRMLNTIGNVPTISNSYSSGSITGTGNVSVGGLVGSYLAPAGPTTTTNNFWDTQSSGIATDAHTGLGVTGRTTSQMQTLATFTGATWSMTDVPSVTSTAPAFTWFIFPNQTRPMLMMENTPNVGTPHSIQMMGGALGGNYTLVRNIDFTNMFNNTSEVWATNRITPVGEGFVPIGNSINNFTGTVNGNGQLINGLYINKTITAGNAGLFGVANNATIRNLSVTNASISQSVSPNASGIIAGILSGTSSLATSYASGSINNTGDTGGLVGNMTGTSSVANAYNLATVTSNVSGSAGGVVGNMVSGTPSITNTYNTNTVTATTTPGGIVGNFGAGGLLNNYWDTQTSGISSTQGCGSIVSCSGTTGLTTAQSMLLSSYAGWSITATPSISAYAPNFTWFIVNATNGSTRPMLMIENNQNIVNAHQLQMMEATLGGTYQLLNNIDLVNGLTDIHDVWNTNYITPTGLGFVPVGAGTAATAFQGFFRGQNYIINNLYINRPTQNFIGLFGTNINNGATINNVGLTNANITGQQAVGGIVGQNSNSGAAGFTGGTTINQTGHKYSDIFKVYVTGNVNATSSFLGGITGLNSFGNISYSYETANVLATGASPVIGGFAGENMGVITASYAAGSVTTQVTGASFVGGFAGVNFYGQINQSYSTGSVYAANGSTNVGGFVGVTSSSVVTNATNLITNSYSFSNVVTSNSANVGGFVGSMTIGSGNVPTISNSFSMGAILGSGNINQGGFGGNYVGTAVTTNLFWDNQRSGVVTDARASGQTTIGMMTPSTFSTWNTTTIWNIITGHTYPFMRVFYSGTPQAISGTSTAIPDSLITIALNGSVLNTVPVGANSFFYVLNGLNNISSIDTRLPSGGLILAYQSGSASVGNDIAVITSSTARLSGVYDAILNPVGNGLILSLNTVTAGNTGTISGGLSNAQLSTAKGALSDVGIFYAVSGTDLTNNVNKHFATTLATTYTLDGNITLTNGNVTLNGPLLISAASPTISTASSGVVSFLNTINGTVANTKSLTVSNTNPAASSIVFSSPIGATAALNNLSLTGNTQFNNGIGATVFVVGAEAYNGALVLNNIPTLSLNGTSVTFGGAVTSVTSPTSLTIPGNLIVTTTGSMGQSGQVLNSLTVTGTTSNGGNITTTNNQLYNGVYTLTGSNILTSNAGSITFNSTVDSNGTPRSLTLDAFLPVTLTGNIGTGLGGVLSTLHIINQTNINTGVVNTTTSQLYDGVVVLGTDVVLTTTNVGGFITFGSTLDDTSAGLDDLTINSDQVRFKDDIGSLNALDMLSVNANIINFDGNVTSVTTLGTQIYTGTGINPLMTIGVDPVFTAPSFVIAIPVVIAADTFYISTVGDIDFQNTVDGPANLTLTPAGTAIFQGDVGATTPLASLTVNGTATFNKPVSQVVNTVGSQVYTNTVTLATDITMTATGNSGILGREIISFGFGAAGIYSDAPNTRSLTIFTNNAANGPSGAGISGTVNVGFFTMGGTGGGDISPITMDSFVGGLGTTGAWDNTFIVPGATGLYCVNGNCTGALIITATDDAKVYGQLFTPTLFSTTGASGGDVISITLTSTFGSPTTATVLGDPYSIIASNASSQGITNNHYTSITYVSGQLTVNPAALTLTSDSQNKNYGVTLSPTTTFFTPTGLQNGETVGTIDIASVGLPGAAPVGIYPITIVPSSATGGTFDPTNYNISYVSAGAINVVAGPTPPAPPINLIDVPPTQEFIPPEGPNCGIAGCDNTGIIIVDILNGIGIREDIIIYPIGIPPELMYSPEESNVLGVVTESSGVASEAIGPNGIVRALNIGDVIYKNDTVIAGETRCVCIKTISHEKKCTTNTKVDNTWSNTCKANVTKVSKVGAGYKPAHAEHRSAPNKNNNLLPKYSLMSVLETMKERIVRP